MDPVALLKELTVFPNAEPPDVLSFIRKGVLPRLKGAGLDDLRLDGRGNLIARMSPEGGPPLYLCAYAQDFPPGSMKDPYLPREIDGGLYGQEGPCLWGRGNCEHRAALASALVALCALAEERRPWRPITFLVLATGESGHHEVIRLLFEENGLVPGPAIIARGTGNRVCLGNKGSLKGYVEVRGRSSHPSAPHLALNAIEGAEVVLLGLRRFAKEDQRRDPELGESLLIPISIESWPKGPIIPDRCRIELSGRLVPGDDPKEVFSALREGLRLPEGFRVEVILEHFHLPAKVPKGSPLGALALSAVEEVQGQAESLYMGASLDAGFFCEKGQDAISLGPGDPALAHSDRDMVSVLELRRGAEIYLGLMRRWALFEGEER
jgi:acetylornithine deacetylase/succinyl-diaminopimelate desuccinylase-like protein